VFNFCIQSFYQLGEAFINSSWCSFEAEYTLSLKLNMKESKTIIPLYTDNYSLINKPTFLKPFSAIDCTLSPDKWYPHLIEGIAYNKFISKCSH
jgi:hypothetical protein